MVNRRTWTKTNLQNLTNLFWSKLSRCPIYHLLRVRCRLVLWRLSLLSRDEIEGKKEGYMWDWVHRFSLLTIRGFLNHSYSSVVFASTITFILAPRAGETLPLTACTSNNTHGNLRRSLSHPSARSGALTFQLVHYWMLTYASSMLYHEYEVDVVLRITFRV